MGKALAIATKILPVVATIIGYLKFDNPTLNDLGAGFYAFIVLVGIMAWFYRPPNKKGGIGCLLGCLICFAALAVVVYATVDECKGSKTQGGFDDVEDHCVELAKNDSPEDVYSPRDLTVARVSTVVLFGGGVLLLIFALGRLTEQERFRALLESLAEKGVTKSQALAISISCIPVILGLVGYLKFDNPTLNELGAGFYALIVLTGIIAWFHTPLNKKGGIGYVLGCLICFVALAVVIYTTVDECSGSKTQGGFCEVGDPCVELAKNDSPEDVYSRRDLTAASVSTMLLFGCGLFLFVLALGRLTEQERFRAFLDSLTKRS